MVCGQHWCKIHFLSFWSSTKQWVLGTKTKTLGGRGKQDDIDSLPPTRRHPRYPGSLMSHGAPTITHRHVALRRGTGALEVDHRLRMRDTCTRSNPGNGPGHGAPHRRWWGDGHSSMAMGMVHRRRLWGRTEEARSLWEGDEGAGGEWVTVDWPIGSGIYWG
jgi:hypothetical protein